MQVSKNGAQSRKVFENASLSFTCAGRAKGGVLNSMRSYIHTTIMRMLCNGCYRLAFLYGREKTVQISHVWTHLFENGM